MAFIFFDRMNKYGNLFVVFCSTCFLKMEAEMALYNHGLSLGKIIDGADGGVEITGADVDFITQLSQTVFGLSSLYRKLPKNVFSTVLFPGIIPRYPLSDAVEVVKFLQSPYFLTAGHHLGYDIGFKNSDVDGRMKSELDRGAISEILIESHLPDQRFFTQVHAEHTGQQADWVAEMTKKNGINALVLMAASGHIMRAFATLVRSLDKINHWVPVIPVSHAINPLVYLTPNMNQDSEDDDGTDFSQYDFCLGEVPKILRYKDDVMQSKLLVPYCEWLATHPLISSFRLDGTT